MQLSSVFSLLLVALAILLGFALGQQQANNSPIYRQLRQDSTAYRQGRQVDSPIYRPARQRQLENRAAPVTVIATSPIDQSNLDNNPQDNSYYQYDNSQAQYATPESVRPFPPGIAMSTATYPVYPPTPMGYPYPPPSPIAPLGLGLLETILALKSTFLPSLVKGGLVVLGFIFIIKLIINLLALPKTAAIAGAAPPQLILTKTVAEPLNSVDAAAIRHKRNASPLVADGMDQLENLVKILEVLSEF